MTVDSTVINTETVSEILDPSSPLHLEDLRSDKVTKDENPNVESFVLQSSISDMITGPQKVEKSGSAALKIPKKKAVVKKKKKSKINFTSLQKKKVKIVSTPVKSSKLSVNSRMSSSSSNLCPFSSPFSFTFTSSYCAHKDTLTSSLHDTISK